MQLNWKKTAVTAIRCQAAFNHVGASGDYCPVIEVARKDRANQRTRHIGRTVVYRTGIKPTDNRALIGCGFKQLPVENAGFYQ